MVKYVPYVPESLEDLIDKTGAFMLKSPRFSDPTLHLPLSIDTAFSSFNEGLRRLRPQLGEQLYRKLLDMSHEMRACFEADPDDDNGETHRGRLMVNNMRDLLEARIVTLRAAAGAQSRHPADK